MLLSAAGCTSGHCTPTPSAKRARCILRFRPLAALRHALSGFALDNLLVNSDGPAQSRVALTTEAGSDGRVYGISRGCYHEPQGSDVSIGAPPGSPLEPFARQFLAQCLDNTRRELSREPAARNHVYRQHMGGASYKQLRASCHRSPETPWLDSPWTWPLGLAYRPCRRAKKRNGGQLVRWRPGASVAGRNRGLGYFERQVFRVKRKCAGKKGLTVVTAKHEVVVPEILVHEPQERAQSGAA